MSTAMNPNEALPCEDIVSWIEEFSYIYSSGLFGSDDVLISGDNECPSLQEQSKVDVRNIKSNLYGVRHSAKAKNRYLMQRYNTQKDPPIQHLEMRNHLHSGLRVLELTPPIHILAKLAPGVQNALKVMKM